MNAILNLLPDTLMNAIAWTILHSLWQGFLISLLVFTVLFLFRRGSAIHRYMVFASGLFLLLVSVIVTFFVISEGDTAQPVITHISNASQGPILSDYQGTGDQDALWFSVDSFRDYFDRHAGWMALLWFIGAIMFTLRSLGGILYIQRLKSASTIFDDHTWNGKLSRLARKVGVSQKIRLAETWKANVPMVIGFFKPVIILPIGILNGLTTDQVEAILVHELVHIRRKDYLVNILQSLAEALLFFNPAVWWLSGQMRLERENICDDAATAHIGKPLDYARALVTVGESNLPYQNVLTPLIGRRKRLLNRIKRMTNMKKSNNGVLGGLTISLFIALAMIMITAGATITYTDEVNPEVLRDQSLVQEKPLAGQPGEIPETAAVKNAEEVHSSAAVAPIAFAVTDTLKKEASGEAQKEEQARETLSEFKEKQEQMLMQKQIQQEKQFEHQAMMERRLAEMQERLQELQERIQTDSSFLYIKDGDTVNISGYWNKEMIPNLEGLYESAYDLYLEAPDFQYDIPEVEWEVYNEQLKDFYRQYADKMHDNKDLYHEHMDRAVESYEKAMRNMEKHQQKRFMEMQKDLPHLYKPFTEDLRIPAPDLPDFYFHGPHRDLSKTDRIIFQELENDNLVKRGGDYIVEINEREMVVNGEKQSRSVYKKYKRLYESLEGEEPLDYRKIF